MSIQHLDSIISALTHEANRRYLLTQNKKIPVEQLRFLEGEVSGYRNAIQAFVIARDLAMQKVIVK